MPGPILILLVVVALASSAGCQVLLNINEVGLPKAPASRIGNGHPFTFICCSAGKAAQFSSEERGSGAREESMSEVFRRRDDEHSHKENRDGPMCALFHTQRGRSPWITTVVFKLSDPVLGCVVFLRYPVLALAPASLLHILTITIPILSR